MVPDKHPRDPLSATLHALADPTRRAILARLMEGETSVAELAKPFTMTPRAISKHVRVLEDAGLVSRRRDAQRNISRLEPENLRLIQDWLEDYRALWIGRFDRLDRLLAERGKERDV